MTRSTKTGVLLLIAIVLWCGTVSAVHAGDTGNADLGLTKSLQTEGPVFAGDQIVWEITIVNNGPDEATNINVTEDPEGLGDYTLDGAVASVGTFHDADLNWTIPALANGASATLTLKTTVAEAGEKVNRAAITALDQADPVPANNTASSSASASRSTLAQITIKPETLNLKSRGVFTVFIRFSEDFPLSGIDLGKSRLVCNGSEPEKLMVSQKDGGTIIAKYRRQDLVDVSAGNAVTITCEGTISSGGETVKVTGSDIIRVTGEKKKGLDAFFAHILDTVLPLDDEAGDMNAGNATATTTTPTPGQDQTGNRGQLKKAGANVDALCTENCGATDSPTIKGNNKKAGGTDDQDTLTDSQGKGNQGNGNGNGKGNSNKPDSEKGKGKNKE